MKKITLIAIALVAMAATFTSCKKDTTTPAPTISFNNVTGDAVSVNSGESYTVNADLVASAKFKAVTYTVAYGSTSNTYNVQWGSNDTAFHFTATIPNITVTTAVTISVTDKNDINTSKTLTINVGASGPSLGAEITNVKLYSADVNGANACAASSSGVVYTPETMSSGDRGKVDFIWVYDNMYSVASTQASSDAGIQSICSGWSPANATTFLKVTDIDYSSATYAQIFAKDASITGTIASSLAANDVVVFKTQAGKYGIFKVASISGTFQTTDYIIINIKVQQ